MNFQVFTELPLYENEEKFVFRIIQLGFESHITQIYPAVSYILLQKNLVPHTPPTSSLLPPSESSSISIEKHNIFTGGSGNIHAKKLSFRILLPKVKTKKQSAPLAVTSHCRSPNPT